MIKNLPKGQRATNKFHRFGLSRFAGRFPKETDTARIEINGLVQNSTTISDQLNSLQWIEQTCDFHCVTTWSFRSLTWGGYRFRDFYENIILPENCPNPTASILILKGQDGARTTMLLKDALAEDVLLANSLNDDRLSIEHGGPLRFVAPNHYGYKSIKYLSKIEFCDDYSNFHPSVFLFMDHPRARVALEERGRWVPGWILRYLYKPLINSTIKQFEDALEVYNKSGSE